MNALEVIQKFLVTEKTALLETKGVYSCFISDRATKIDVKAAFESLYGVKVAKVNIAKTLPKFARAAKGIRMKRHPKTKAYVTLQKGQTIADVQILASK